ncbi:MAG: hypothetical protein ACTSQV_01985 [Alphaproteobacteria bacterium]
MTTFNTHFSAANARELEHKLRRVWRHGASMVIGWHVAANGLKILHLPSYALSTAATIDPGILAPDKRIANEADYHRLVKLGAKAESVPLSFDIPRDESVCGALNHFIRKFSVTQCRRRGVALFDIVDFSRYPPFDQITLITMLSHHINVAAETCNRLGLHADIRMTTTGDGFYVWNDAEGLGADVTLYCVAMLALIYNYAARAAAKTAAVPTLRCGVHIGPHFQYSQQQNGAGDSQSFIVGDVTVELARMMAAALPNQILIGDHHRETEGGRDIDTEMFVELAQNGLQKLIGLPVPGGRIEAIISYLIGERAPGGRFPVKSYQVIDKHKFTHTCFNAKLNVTARDGNEIHIGCPDTELEGFAA